MSVHIILEQQLHRVLALVERPEPRLDGIDTRTLLYQLAVEPEWTTAQFADVDFISKRLDISGKLFSSYQQSGRKSVGSEPVEHTWLALAVIVLMKAALLNRNNDDKSIRLKRFNVLFKSLDLVKAETFGDTDLLGAVEAAWESFIQTLSVGQEDVVATSLSGSGVGEVTQYATIPLTIMFYEGPIARAYLETIKSLGLKPQKIIELVAEKDIATKKPVGKWLPKGIRTSYASSIQRSKIHYWPKQLKKTSPEFIDRIVNEIEAKFQFPKAVVEGANSLLGLAEYCGNIESPMVENLSDDRLLDYLAHEPEGAILFTGGGILPEQVLTLPQLKFLHIHPGFLPAIRGADCALWSTLLTGHTSATCFYMSPGIDTGDIILPCWLPKLEISADKQKADIANQYRAVYSFIDPWVRAFVLRELLLAAPENFSVLNSMPQDESDGLTFHFMHEKLRSLALKNLMLPI